MEIQTARIIRRTQAEGPGYRYCIWVQGCDIRCNGCANREMWDFAGGAVMDTAELIADISFMQNEIEGITFLGGEPLCQVEAVSEIAAAAQAINLTVVVFTGREYGKLIVSSDESTQKLLQHTDLLIDGPFRVEQIDYSRPWVGSRNQKYWFLSSRYEALRDKLTTIGNRLELHIRPDGKILLNGMADVSIFADNTQWILPNLFTESMRKL